MCHKHVLLVVGERLFQPQAARIVQCFVDVVEGMNDIVVDFDRLVSFDEVMEWAIFSGEAGYVITVVFNKTTVPLKAFFGFWKRQFLKVVSNLVRRRGNAFW